MCGRHTYLLTWEQIVRLYRLTLDQPAQNTGLFFAAKWRIGQNDIYAIALTDFSEPEAQRISRIDLRSLKAVEQ